MLYPLVIPSENDPGVLSRYFTVLKIDGDLCPILDLRDFNYYIIQRRFHIVTLECIVPILQDDDWFAVIDLSNAYFQITIHQEH